MPGIRGNSIFSVPEPDADLVLQEVLIRAKAKDAQVTKTFDPSLGASYDEAEEKLAGIRADVGLFGQHVFGLAPARVHQHWNQAIDDVIAHRIPQNKLLILAPPNSAKSTWCSLIRPTHYLGLHPDHNLLFFTSSDPMANTFHRAIEGVLRENEKYAQVFSDPENRPDRKRGWSSDGLYLAGTPAISKDGAYRSVGFGASVMGARAHGIIIDDPMNQEQAKSEPEQRRAKEYSSQTVMRRLHPVEGWVVCVMTRFHENDLASHYIDLAEADAGWVVIRTPLIATNDPTPDPLGRETGELLWPEHLTPEYVRAEQHEMTIAEFNLVHQADVTGLGGDIFEQESWFQPLPGDFWSTILPGAVLVQFWDLAFSESRQACYTVGITAAVDSQWNIYVVDVVRARLNLGTAKEEMVRLISVTKPMVVGMETDRFHQKAVEALAQAVLDEVMVNIQLVRPTDDKVSRARLPAARAQAGKLFVHLQAPWARAFLTELLAFPNSKYKDQVDALSGLTGMVQQLDRALRTRKVLQAETVMSG